MNMQELISKIEKLKTNINHAKWMYTNSELGSNSEIEYGLELEEYRCQLNKLLKTKLGDLVGYEHENN